MFERRCPYCGELLSNATTVMTRIFSKLPGKCPHCENKFILHHPKILLTAIPYGIFSILDYSTDYFKNPVMWVLGLLLAVICIYVIYMFIPLQKYSFGDIIVSDEADYIVKCDVIWDKAYSKKRLFFYSGCILPVCFVDENDRPISQMWCVDFRKVRNLRSKTKCRIQFVLNDAPLDLLKTNNRFYIFNNKQRIALGKVIDVEFLK